jgi:hypothetical protein
MKIPLTASLCLVLVSLAAGPFPAAAANLDDGLVISEFMANNVTTIRDDFSETSDYVEIYNGSAAAIDLGNYYLTDDSAKLTKWQFPATNILSGQHLLVWASGRNIRVPGKPLHTSFSLNANGEELLLVRKDLSIVYGYTFGPQAVDRSYGLTTDVQSTSTLVPIGALARYLSPTNSVASLTNADPAKRWIAPDYDDTTWASGPTGIGFDKAANSVFTPFIATDIASLMYSNKPAHTDLYLRIPFVVPGPSIPENPLLQIRYDDGFVAWLNGVEIGRRRLTNAVPLWNSIVTTVRSNELAIIPDEVATYAAAGALRVGPNVLAIQVANKSATDPDLLVVPQLVSRQIRYLTGVENERYFPNPTPGAANAVGAPGVGGPITFSATSTTFRTDFDLTLVAADATPLTQIRYTVDGSVPGTNSILYNGVIHITNSIPIRARSFEPGYLPGPVHSEAFVKLGAGAENISSDVAMIIVSSFGASTLDDTIPHPSFLFVFEPIHGRSSFTNPPTKVFRAGLKIRGSSTAGNAKSNWAVQPWDEDDLDYDTPLLGMPSGSPWVFHAPLSFDPSRFHNPLASDLSNKLGDYASRYRFAEVYLNTTSPTNKTATAAALNLTYSANYFGFYNILEHIDVSPNRVNVDKLTAADNALPEVSGGYLFSIDRALGSDPQYTFGTQDTLNLLDPDARHITPDQLAFLKTYFDAYAKALFAKDFTNGNYTAFMDVPAWIDHHIVNVLACNVDGMRLSGYFHKVRNGPIVYGPVWDFDRAFGSTDGRDQNPYQWRGGGDATYFFTTGSSPNLAWWPQLFKDINFWQAWVDRWQELREGPYSTPHMFALMDEINSHIVESAPRDAARWGNNKRLADGTSSTAATQASELAYFKNWMKGRMKFMDTNFLAKPLVGTPSGQVAPGTQITLSAPAGATIYYTMDGTDPRAMHGAIDPAALVYTGPITVGSETRLVARSRDLTHKNLTGGDNPPLSTPWSGPTRARYVLNPLAAPGDLVLTEINYHPADPTAAELAATPGLGASDFEFIEIKNVSSHTVDFYGARFTKGVNYTFVDPSAYTLDAGAIMLLVRNQAAFTARYGARPNIVGQYTGSLNDNGDTLRLETESGIALFDVSFQDDWYPTTDGFGYTLVRVNLNVGDSSREAWGPSSANGGSPGVENPAQASIPLVVINEVLANPANKQSETVELLNRGKTPADISGWYLTDDRSVPKKFRVPDNTVPIAAGGFRLFTSKDYNSGGASNTNAFGLSSLGDALWLFSADAAGNLLPYSYGFSFGATPSGVSLGRHVISTGKELFVPQKNLSLGAANAGPLVGPIVVNEIMYHPPETLENGTYWDNDRDEYIVLKNISAQPVGLYDGTLNGEWHLRGTVSYDFPSTFSLVPDGIVILVGFNPDTDAAQLQSFRAKYGVTPATPILGPWKGKLANSAGVVRVTRPESADPDTGDLTYVTLDEVEYEDQSPWPTAADGSGASLRKKDPSLFGNDPANWMASLPVPAGLPLAGNPPGITTQPQGGTVVAGTSTTLTVVAQSASPISYSWRRDGANIQGANGPSLVLNPVALTDAGHYTVVLVNGSGSVESAPATLNVLQPATIIEGPESIDAKPGGNVTFSVKATGTGRLSYQWRFNGTPISGATDSILSLQNVQLQNTGPYTVTVTDSIGSTTSDPAVLRVLVRPTFVQQPTPQTAVVGDTVEFQVVMAGLEPFSYKWRRNTTTITPSSNPTATNRVFRIPNVQTTNATNYSVAVSNPAIPTSTTNSILVPLIVMEDKDGDHMGDAWELQNGLDPTNPADALRDDDGDGFNNLQEFLAGTNPKDKTSYLKIDSIRETAAGVEIGFLAHSNRTYSLDFKEAAARGDWQPTRALAGSTNDKPVTVLDRLPDSITRVYRISAPASLSSTIPDGPTLLLSPFSQIVDEGSPVAFEVQATGAEPFSYAWTHDGKPVTSQTTSILNLDAATPSDAGAYVVTVTDASGLSVVTKAASLTVIQRPVITRQPQGATLNTGQTLTLSVVATGPAPLTYRWLFNEHPITGAVNPLYVVPRVSPANAGSYRVIVSMPTPNGVQSRSSDTAVIRVNE